MSHQEKNIVVSLFAFIVTFIFFYARVSEMYGAGRFEGDAGLILLGKTGLAFIGVGIIAVVVLLILYHILYAAITGDSVQKEITDERDRMIERRGMQISGVIAGMGLVAAMIALALGYGAVPVFIGIVAAFAAAEFISAIARLTMYQLGW